MALMWCTAVVLTLLSAANALPKPRPFEHALRARQNAGNDALTVDLGYALYQGYGNASTGINTWRGRVWHQMLAVHCD